MRILIANRGEIACRVIRTAKRLGHETVAVFADPDEFAPFVSEADHAVRLGPAALAESYLSAEQLLAAAAETRADAVHPGYGFLSENAEFAQAVLDAGLNWIGPKPDAIATMGSKIEARRLRPKPGCRSSRASTPRSRMTSQRRPTHRVPRVEGCRGGGGKGIRIAETPATSPCLQRGGHEATARSATGASSSSATSPGPPCGGSGRRRQARHGHRTRHPGCSVQRRYQKWSKRRLHRPPRFDRDRAAHRCASTRRVDRLRLDRHRRVRRRRRDRRLLLPRDEHRLQVEHPVTEAITGLDLVELQIRAATSLPLGVAQDSVAFAGHAIEVRINAEDATNDFAPQIGQVVLDVPDSVRWDAAIELGSTITPHYDPMIAKLIVHAATRRLPSPVFAMASTGSSSVGSSPMAVSTAG